MSLYVASFLFFTGVVSSGEGIAVYVLLGMLVLTVVLLLIAGIVIVCLMHQHNAAVKSNKGRIVG